jgi:hypothetical protein
MKDHENKDERKKKLGKKQKQIEKYRICVWVTLFFDVPTSLAGTTTSCLGGSIVGMGR